MKKKLLLVSLIMCCVLVGCGKKDKVSETTEENVTQVVVDSVEEQEAPVEEVDANAIAFKGAEGITVNCPEGYEAKADKEKIIEFVPTEKSEDEHLALSAELLETKDYDEYLSKGQYKAEIYMKKFLCDKVEELYGEEILYYIGCNFVDGDSYWDITGIVYLDGSKASPKTEDDLVTAIELRYTGPDSYMVMTKVTALEENMPDYAGVAQEIDNSVKTDSDWTTCPKDYPSADAMSIDTEQFPAIRSSKKIELIQAVCDGTEKSDISGVFLWIDKDGDIWFNNGVGNEFVGYGEDVYVEIDDIYSNNENEWVYGSLYEFEYYDYYDAWGLLGYEAYFDNFEGYYEFFDGEELDDEDEGFYDIDDEDDESFEDDGEFADEEWIEKWGGGVFDEDITEDDEDWENDEDWEDDYEEDDSDDDESWDDEDWEDDEEWVED